MTAPGNELSASRVLVVGDAETIRAALESSLGLAGHTVILREDTRDLERDLADFRPDVVILDAMLPGRDGFDCWTSCARGRAQVS